MDMSIINKKVSSFATPFYLFDCIRMLDNITRLRNLFSYPETDFFYSLKTNDFIPLLRLLEKNGMQCEVESSKGLELARKIGFRKIIFNGVAKTSAELELACKKNDCIVIIDNLDELYALENITKNKIQVGLRIGIVQSHMYKFGMQKEDFIEAVEYIYASEILDLGGFHFHVGSFVLDIMVFKRALTKLSDYMHSVPKKFFESVKFINIGGGFPCEGKIKKTIFEKILDTYVFRYSFVNMLLLREEQKNKYEKEQFDSEVYLSSLSKIIQEYFKDYCKMVGHKVNLFLEPGTVISGNAFDVYAKVVRIKRNMVFLDVSRFIEHGYMIYNHFIYNYTRPSNEINSALIFGPLGTNNDLFSRVYQGERLQVGDIVRIASMGAYTYSTRKSFVKSQPTVLIKKGDFIALYGKKR